jgi:hypothetical protein
MALGCTDLQLIRLWGRNFPPLSLCQGLPPVALATSKLFEDKQQRSCYPRTLTKIKKNWKENFIFFSSLSFLARSSGTPSPFLDFSSTVFFEHLFNNYFNPGPPLTLPSECASQHSSCSSQLLLWPRSRFPSWIRFKDRYRTGSRRRSRSSPRKFRSQLLNKPSVVMRKRQQPRQPPRARWWRTRLLCR